MADEKPSGGMGRPATVDDLIALNEEIVALVRSGAPLERGLARSSEELPGKLKEIASTLSARMGRGEGLVEAMEAEGKTIPPLYRAVVEAGVRSGDLGTALGGLTRYLRGYAEARNAVGLAFWYPLLLMTFAYLLSIGLLTQLAPRLADAFESLRLPIPRALEWLVRLGSTAFYWWPIWPLILLGMVVAWVRSGRSARFDPKSWSLVGSFPWTRSILADYQSAGFADLAALLLENRISYPRAVRLAAEATGNPGLTAEVQEAARGLERGVGPAEALSEASTPSLAPMLRWVLSNEREPASLVGALRDLSTTYRRRAALRADRLRLFLPAAATLVIGASVTLLYALSLFLPLSDMLTELANP